MGEFLLIPPGAGPNPGSHGGDLSKCPVLGSLGATAWPGFAVLSFGKGFHRALAGCGAALGLPDTVLSQRAAIFGVTPGDTSSTSLLCCPAEPAHPGWVRLQHCRSLCTAGNRVERAHSAASPVMKGDGPVLTTAAVTNPQLPALAQPLDPPEDALSAADVAPGVSCNV